MEKPIEKQLMTNEERRFFGLDPILSHWERFEIKPGFCVYFDGDTIRKTISCRTVSEEGYENFIDYAEHDKEIQTRDRKMVLPRTKRGKEKKLNYTSVSSMNPTGCTFRMNLSRPGGRSYLWAGNIRNSISLPVGFPDNIATLAEFREWLASFMTNCPTDYFEKVDRMKNTPHRTVKYFNGDIFRFEIDLEHYGFGLIMGQIRDMKKDGLLADEHILRSTMGVSLLVRLYQLETTDKQMNVETITSHPLGKPFIMMDNQVIWGAYDIVGSKTLEATDIEFPIQAGKSISHQNPDYARICWGPGIIIKRNVTDFPVALKGHALMRHGCYFGVGGFSLEDMGNGNQEKTGLDELEQIAFRYFGLPLNMTYDEFNRAHGGMTRGEYAEYANKTGRHASKK